MFTNTHIHPCPRRIFIVLSEGWFGLDRALAAEWGSPSGLLEVKGEWITIHAVHSWTEHPWMAPIGYRQL